MEKSLEKSLETFEKKLLTSEKKRNLETFEEKRIFDGCFNERKSSRVYMVLGRARYVPFARPCASLAREGMQLRVKST